MVSYRKMQDSDYNGVMQLIHEFYEDYLEEFGSSINIDVLTKTFDKLKDSSFIVEEDHKVVGLLGGRIVTDELSDEKTYAEVMWFMSKYHRKYGLKLLYFVEDWVRAQGMKRMMMVHLCNEEGEKLLDFYTRLGYTPMEMHYIKQL